jgi:S1-C subfamily serine protease
MLKPYKIIVILFIFNTVIVSGCIGSSREDKEGSLKTEAVRNDDKTRIDLIERSAFLISGAELKVYRKKISDYSDSPFKCLSTSEENIKNNKSVALGMACAISPGNRYLTAAHCISGDPPHYIFRVDDQKNVYLFPVVVIWTDEGSDLGLLEAQEKPNLPYFEVGKNTLQPGELVITLGNFSEMGAGKVLYYTNDDGQYSVMAHTAPIRPGDSGGPVVNKELKLVGITTKLSCLNFPKLWEHKSLATSLIDYMPHSIGSELHTTQPQQSRP